MQHHSIGIDLGGTKTEIVVLSPSAEVLLRKRVPTPKSSGYEAICTAICELVNEGQSVAGGNATVGIGIPGFMDHNTGKVVNANTTVLIGKPLKSDLEVGLTMPVRIENDANCFVLAEVQDGAAKGISNVFGVIMGTGCGGGLVCNGKIYHGRHGIAGEWGHFSIDPNGQTCWCGNKGCIETMISGTAIEQHYFRRTGVNMKAPEIIAKARQKSNDAVVVFDQFIDDFGRALGGLISVFDPDMVVIGGGLSHIDELYSDGVAKIKNYVFHSNITTPVVRNQLGDSAGVFGAARLWSYE